MKEGREKDGFLEGYNYVNQPTYSCTLSPASPPPLLHPSPISHAHHCCEAGAGNVGSTIHTQPEQVKD